MHSFRYGGGVFALWSIDPPDPRFMRALEEIFTTCESHVIKFYPLLQDRDSASTVRAATKGGNEKL